jgi:deazaflavin-dependent oxidoreductase (nitroreductase family)
MSDKTLADYADADVLYLTTVGHRSGLPRMIEIWFVYHAGKLYLNAERRRAARWVRNILQDARVRVRLEDREFKGRARVLNREHDADLWLTVAELSRRKYGWGEGLPVEISLLER